MLPYLLMLIGGVMVIGVIALGVIAVTRYVATDPRLEKKD